MDNDCGFCQREEKYAIPLLPVRAAISPTGLDLPELPANFNVLVPAEGDVRYTTRLLTQGFLYVYDEKLGAEGKEPWSDYMITEGGYYYRLPTTDIGPERPMNRLMMERTEFSCRIDLSHEAKASFITVLAHKHFVTRLVWSPVSWTTNIRNKFNQRAYREQHMYTFDSGSWYDYVMSKQEAPSNVPDCVGMRAMGNVVSEYIPYAEKCVEMFNDISLASFQAKKSELIRNIHAAADKILFHGGVIFNLNDPTGAASELALSMQDVVQKTLTRHQAYQDDVILYGYISQLKSSIENEAVNNYLKNIKLKEESGQIHGGPVILNPSPKNDDEAEEWARLRMEKLRLENKDVIEKIEKEAWENYQQRLQPGDTSKKEGAQLNKSLRLRSSGIDEFVQKQEAVGEKLQKDYLDPMANMLAAIHSHDVFVGQFRDHFDPQSLMQGRFYTRLLLRCLIGTQGNPVCKQVYSRWAKDEGIEYNLLFRGFLFNYQPLVDAVSSEAQKATSYGELPWEQLFDIASKFLDMQIESKAMTDLVEALTNSVNVPLAEVMNQQANNINHVSRMIIGLGVTRRVVMVPIEITGRQSQFISEIIRQVHQASGVILTHQEVKRLLDRLGIGGMKVAGTKQRKFYFIACNEDALKAGQVERMLKDGLRFHEYSAHNTAQIAESERQRQRIMANRRGAVNANFVFKGLILVLQGASVMGLMNEKEKWVNSNDQKGHRTVAGLVALLGGTIEMSADAALTYLALSTPKRTALKYVKTFGKGLGIAAGIGFAGLDFYNMFTTDNNELTYYYGASGFISAGGVIVLFLSGGTALICAVIVIGASLIINYLIEQIKGDDIENWLMRTHWGIPYDSSVVKYINAEGEQQGYRILIGAEQDPKEEARKEKINSALEEYNNNHME